MRDNPTPGTPKLNRRSGLATGLALLAYALPLFGLELERVIPLNPFGTKGATLYASLVLNPLRNRLYGIGSQGWAVVIDCAENRIEGEMPVPALTGSPALWSAALRKAYSLTAMGIVVIDGTADTIRATIPTPGKCWNAAFDDTSRCLVATVPESSRVLVVCGNGDTLKRQLRTTREPLWVIWNSVSGRYNTLEVKRWGDSCYMTVFDAASGAVLDSFPLEAVAACALVYTPTSNKVYAGTDSGVIVVDGSSNRVLKRLSFPVEHLVWNQPGNKLYCCNKDTVRVVDCAADSLLKLLILPGEPSGIRSSCATRANRVWLGGSAIYVVDAGTDSLIAVVSLPGRWGMTYNEREDCVYVTPDYQHVLALDEPSCQIRDTIVTGLEMFDLCSNPKVDKLYARDVINNGRSDSYITVVDRPTGQMLKRLYTGQTVVTDCLMVLDLAQDKLYCPNSDDGTISVIDCHRDSIIKTIAVAPEPFYLAVNTTNNKLYCTHCDWPAQLTVVDCRADSVVAVIPLPNPFWARRVWWHAGVNKAYVEHNDGMFTVIDGRTNQVVGEFGPFPNVLGLACDNKHNRLYVSIAMNWPALYALDAVGDTVVNSFPQLYDVGWVVRNGRSDKVYFTGWTPPPEPPQEIGVIDCAQDSFLRALPQPPGRMLTNVPSPATHPTEARVYFNVFGDPRSPGPQVRSGIWAIDCNLDTVADFAAYPLEDEYTCRVSVDGTRNLVFANGISRIYVMRDQVPGVTDKPAQAPRRAALECSPNPTLGSLAVQAWLPEAQPATLAIYDRAGDRIRAFSTARAARHHSWRWDGSDEQGRKAAAGVYFLSVTTGNRHLCQKVIRLR